MNAFVVFVIFLAISFVAAEIITRVSNRRILESEDTIGEVQVVYEFVEGEPNDKPLVFFVSYVPVEDLKDNTAAKIVVRVKNM